MGDDDYERSCQCQFMPMPPCGFCENLTEEETDALWNPPKPEPKPDPLAHIEGYATW